MYEDEMDPGEDPYDVWRRTREYECDEDNYFDPDDVVPV